jgi:hypothetical protein
MELVILNLAINARDAMPDGGTFSITMYNSDFGEDVPQELAIGQYIVMTVTDTGVGMDEATLARATEPFFTTKEVGKGSGLGLSQVYGFANESAGHVTLRSEVGRGTTIKLYLPRCNGALEEVEDRPALAVAQRSSSGTVLVVDDDEAVLETAKETVADLGYPGHLRSQWAGSASDPEGFRKD